VGPFSKFVGPLDEIFYPASNSLQKTVNHIGHMNDGATIMCQIPLDC
jgi:hypothetical protein